jgi:hypothetical protein
VHEQFFDVPINRILIITMVDHHFGRQRRSATWA